MPFTDFEDLTLLELFCHSVIAAQMSAYKFTREAKQRPLCCLVVDSGFSFSHVVPIYDGKIIKKGVKRYKILYLYLGIVFVVQCYNYAFCFLYRTVLSHINMIFLSKSSL